MNAWGDWSDAQQPPGGPHVQCGMSSRLSAGLVLLCALAAGLSGCAVHPKGECGPSCPTIESASYIVEYPTQRLAILKNVAARSALSQHEQSYIVMVLRMGGLSELVADCYVTLIRNPVCTEQTKAEIRAAIKYMRLQGMAARRIIDALDEKPTTQPRRLR
jgi:hypothetical protein